MFLVANWRTTDWVPAAGIEDENMIENRQDAFYAALLHTHLVLDGGQRGESTYGAFGWKNISDFLTMMVEAGD